MSYDYGPWTLDPSLECRLCEVAGAVEYRLVSDDEGHEDEQLRCTKCGYEWWIDGIDS